MVDVAPNSAHGQCSSISQQRVPVLSPKQFSEEEIKDNKRKRKKKINDRNWANYDINKFPGNSRICAALERWHTTGQHQLSVSPF
jgi:hypothetical protein